VSYTIVRRDFLKCALASVVAISVLRAADARATDLPALDPSDPVAQSLGLVPDASRVAVNTNPTFTPGQRCGVFVQYQGKSSDAPAGCGIFAGHSVPSRGWCGALVQRAAVSLEKDDEGFSISRSALTLRAGAPNRDQDTFGRLARDAEGNCPVSRVLKAEITLDAQLVL
jgi:hypothetical protein